MDEPDSGPTLALLREAQAGSADSFTRLYERVGPALRAYASLRNLQSFGGRLEIEEVLQEVWLRAWRNLPHFDPAKGSMRAWLLRVTQHVLLELSRARLRRDRAAGHRTGAGAESLPDPATSVTRRVARDETVSAFLDRCSELEPTDRLLVLHCGIEGWNCADVARRLDLSHEAIRKRWQRLRQKLTALPGARELLVG